MLGGDSAVITGAVHLDTLSRSKRVRPRLTKIDPFNELSIFDGNCVLVEKLAEAGTYSKL